MEGTRNRAAFLAETARSFVAKIRNFRTDSENFTTGKITIPADQVFQWMENTLLENQSKLLDDTSNSAAKISEYMEFDICEIYPDLVEFINIEDPSLLDSDGAIHICYDTPIAHAKDTVVAERDWNRCFHCGVQATHLHYMVSLCHNCNELTKQVEQGTLDQVPTLNQNKQTRDQATSSTDRLGDGTSTCAWCGQTAELNFQGLMLCANCLTVATDDGS